MHPDIAYHLADQRHAELIAEAARQRLINEARQTRTDLGGQRRSARRWWWILVPSRALASE
jgi:hypothetical protein